MAQKHRITRRKQKSNDGEVIVYIAMCSCGFTIARDHKNLVSSLVRSHLRDAAIINNAEKQMEEYLRKKGK